MITRKQFGEREKGIFKNRNGKITQPQKILNFLRKNKKTAFTLEEIQLRIGKIHKTALYGLIKRGYVLNKSPYFIYNENREIGIK